MEKSNCRVPVREVLLGYPVGDIRLGKSSRGNPVGETRLGKSSRGIVVGKSDGIVRFLKSGWGIPVGEIRSEKPWCGHMIPIPFGHVLAISDIWLSDLHVPQNQ